MPIAKNRDFNIQLFCDDFAKAAKRRRISVYRACRRIGLDSSRLYKMQSGTLTDITVHTMVRMLRFIGTTDIAKYMNPEEPEDANSQQPQNL